MLAVFALLLVGGSAMPQFNNSKCPAFWELQTAHMSKDFNMKQLEGFYYELAFHDATQFPLCPNKVPRCITSNKAVETYPDGQRYVNDTWDLQCFSVEYPQTLLFNETKYPGFVNGYVPVTKIPFLPKSIVSKLVFPNTIVDFKAGPQGYSLEMQCVEWLGHVVFVGINYYTKEKTEEAFQQIDKVARAQGLGFFLDQNAGVHRVNHTGCPNEPKDQLQSKSEDFTGCSGIPCSSDADCGNMCMCSLQKAHHYCVGGTPTVCSGIPCSSDADCGHMCMCSLQKGHHYCVGGTPNATVV